VSPGISDDVRQLLQASIASVRQLDMLMLMRDGGEARTWSASELETALRSSDAAVDTDVAGLLQAGLIEVVTGPPTLWKYAPGGRRPMVDALAGYYRTHRTSVIKAIASATSTNAAMDQFADAFRLRRTEEHDG
jgi:hypothetical protein